MVWRLFHEGYQVQVGNLLVPSQPGIQHHYVVEGLSVSALIGQGIEITDE